MKIASPVRASTQVGERRARAASDAQVRIGSGICFLAGLYVLIAGWIGGANIGNTWNSVVAGIVVLVLAAMRFTRNAGPWASWIDALIGVWLIVSPWVYGYAAETWRWNSIVVGIVLVVFGAWSAMATSDHAAVA